MGHLKINDRIRLNQSANELVFQKTGLIEYVRIEPMLTKLLLAIIDKNGAVATRNELINKVWQGNDGVGAKALTKSIYKLRQVFMEHYGEELIQTIPKEGYRLTFNRRVITRTPGRSRNWVNITIGSAIALFIILKITNPGIFFNLLHGLKH